MGRHGGGSRSGGSHRSSSSRSSGGSRSGGSGVRTSSKPFAGCYNRSYYDRSGRLHTCYTSIKNFGTKSACTNIYSVFLRDILYCNIEWNQKAECGVQIFQGKPGKIVQCSYDLL